MEEHGGDIQLIWGKFTFRPRAGLRTEREKKVRLARHEKGWGMGRIGIGGLTVRPFLPWSCPVRKPGQRRDLR